MSIGIYKITSPSGKIYIGQSKNIEKRWEKNYKKTQCKNQPKIYNSLKKYGPDNHVFEIIEECLFELLLQREAHWKIYYLDQENNNWKNMLFCNLYDRGPKSQETKDKIRNGMLGLVKSQETKDKIKLNSPLNKKIYQYSLEGNFIKEWPSISDANREVKGNIRLNMKGKTKHAGGFLWFREEDLYKLEKRIIIKEVKNTKQQFSKTIIDIDLLKTQYEYMSSTELSKLYNTSIPTMICYLKNNNLYKFRKNYMK